jgi:hypothetical protein
MSASQLMPSGKESSTVLADAAVVDPVDRFLAHLSAIERSPNTVRAYAHDLRDFFEFLDDRGLSWHRVVLEDLGRFVSWLRLPAEARDGRVAVLPWVEAGVSAATVNRKLSALASFYEFHNRHGVGLGVSLCGLRRCFTVRPRDIVDGLSSLVVFFAHLIECSWGGDRGPAGDGGVPLSGGARGVGGIADRRGRGQVRDVAAVGARMA